MTAWWAASSIQMVSTTQSSQTSRFQDDPHSGAFCGDFAGLSFLGFWSLQVTRRLSGDFWRPVSGPQNSVPGG